MCPPLGYAVLIALFVGVVAHTVRHYGWRAALDIWGTVALVCGALVLAAFLIGP